MGLKCKSIQEKDNHLILGDLTMPPKGTRGRTRQNEKSTGVQFSKSQT